MQIKSNNFRAQKPELNYRIVFGVETGYDFLIAMINKNSII